MLDLQPKLAELLKIPGVREILEGESPRQDNDEAIGLREACKATIAKFEADEEKVVTEAAKLRAAFEDKQAAMIEARGRLGAAEARKNAVSHKLNELRRELRIHHGEQAIIDTFNRLTNLASYLPGRIEALELAIKTTPRGQRPLDPGVIEANRRKIADLRDQLAAVKHGLAAIPDLRNAKLSPREIARHARDLLEAAGVADE